MFVFLQRKIVLYLLSSRKCDGKATFCFARKSKLLLTFSPPTLTGLYFQHLLKKKLRKSADKLHERLNKKKEKEMKRELKKRLKKQQKHDNKEE